MAKETVEALIEGGKASAAPPLGPALGPMGVNIGQVVAEINKKTESFKGMQVPVSVIIDTDTKEFSVKVGTPPASALIKKEAGLSKGSGRPTEDFVADLKIEQIIKIAKMKEDALLGKSLKEKVKEIIGTCDSMGVEVEGVQARKAIALINEGNFAEKISSGKTELTQDELKILEEEKKHFQEEIEKKRVMYEKTANEIIASMTGKESNVIRKKLQEAEIPDVIIHQLVPEEKEEGKK
ncbi:MAG: 50S ribosomal protein L11 [Nanoarchaeota archaeon]|nr:50S ribosomal protein L11 [Nanoarchaeota archaeon]MBU1030184.1 50S ribosomal protein L11 [Nanoarchaeota archaeon]